MHREGCLSKAAVTSLPLPYSSAVLQVTWKSKLQAAFPDPNAYSAFMGNFASATGVTTLLMMLAGKLCVAYC
jgi:ATP/ADP translocase